MFVLASTTSRRSLRTTHTPGGWAFKSMIVTALALTVFQLFCAVNLRFELVNHIMSIPEVHQLRIWTYPVSPLQPTPIANGSYFCAYHACRKAVIKQGVLPKSLNLKSLVSHANVPESYRRFVGDQHWFKIFHQLEFPHHVQLVAVISLLLQHQSSSRRVCALTLSYELSKICLETPLFELLKEQYDPTRPLKETLWNESFISQFIPLKLTFSERFGILEYDQRVLHAREANSGDELQTFAGLQFLPYLSDHVDRETGLPSAKEVNFFGNAWWGTKVAFPPHSSANMTMFSMHLSSSFRKVVSDNVEYFRSYAERVGPVGARDIPSFQFLEQSMIPVYLSSCFTQMISMYRDDYTNVTIEPKIIIVDAELGLIPKKIVDVAKIYSASVPKDIMLSRLERHKHAYRLLRIYATEAKVLITSRIHAALPASALGIPVIFVEQNVLPGGGGGRTEGISNLFHQYHASANSSSWPYGSLTDFDAFNPQVHQQDRYRASFWHYIKARADSNAHHYRDTARLFGVIPLTRLGQDETSSHLHSLFHFIYTTPPETLTWRVQRAIEAVFYHHPNAKVMLHSYSLPPKGTMLDVLWESGYDFGIHNYSFISLLDGSSSVNRTELNEITELLPFLRKQKYWYSHETDFIRLLLMEKYGGVYLDTDMHVVKPFSLSIRNLVAWQDPEHHLINGAAMIMDKNSMFIRQCIRSAVVTLLAGYKPDVWNTYGPTLLTKTYHILSNAGDIDVSAAEHSVFYPYPFQLVHKCFESTAATSSNPIDPNKTLAVHLNTKLTSKRIVERGSICSHVFKTHCIFCDASIFV